MGDTWLHIGCIRRNRTPLRAQRTRRILVTPRSQAPPGNAFPEALPPYRNSDIHGYLTIFHKPTFCRAEPCVPRDYQAEPGNQVTGKNVAGRDAGPSVNRVGPASVPVADCLFAHPGCMVGATGWSPTQGERHSPLQYFPHGTRSRSHCAVLWFMKDMFLSEPWSSWR